MNTLRRSHILKFMEEFPVFVKHMIIWMYLMPLARTKYCICISCIPGKLREAKELSSQFIFFYDKLKSISCVLQSKAHSIYSLTCQYHAVVSHESNFLPDILERAFESSVLSFYVFLKIVSTFQYPPEQPL